MADAADFARLMEPIARKLFGAPTATARNGRELRFRSHGSLSIDLDRGTWYDHQSGEGGGVLKLLERERRLPTAEAIIWLQHEGLLTNSPQRPQAQQTAIYDYTDETGALLFQVVRLDGTSGKTFRQRAPDPTAADGWKWSTTGIRRVLYRLPGIKRAIAEGKTIHAVEGEKDADRLWSLGLAATCNPGGAAAWRNEYASFFEGGDLVVIPDYDLPGQQLSEKIAQSATGIARQVRILDLATIWPEIKIKNDVSDWLNNGGSAEVLTTAIDRLPAWVPSKPKPVKLETDELTEQAVMRMFVERFG